MENVDTQTPVSTSEPAQKEVNIMDVPVSNQNIALNVMVFFLNSAQRRGAFSMDESAKMFATAAGNYAAPMENTMESTD